MDTQTVLDTVKLSAISLVDNVRVDKVKANPELVKSIKAVGLLNPLTVRPNGTGDTYELVSGYRRYAALAKIDKNIDVAVTIVDVDNEQLSTMQTHENLHRQDMTLRDYVSLVVELTNRGLNQKSIALALGKTKDWVRKYGVIANLCEPLLAGLQNYDGDSQNVMRHAIKIASYPQSRQLEHCTPGAQLDLDDPWEWNQLSRSLQTNELSLNNAIFDTKNENANPSCVGCEFRQDHQLAVFAEFANNDSDQNPCFNKPCYEQKTEAFTAQLGEDLGIPLSEDQLYGWDDNVVGFNVEDFLSEARGVKTAKKNAIAFSVNLDSGNILLKLKPQKAAKVEDVQEDPDAKEEEGFSNSSMSKWRTYVNGAFKKYIWEVLFREDNGLVSEIAHNMLSAHSRNIGDVCTNYKTYRYDIKTWLSSSMDNSIHNLKVAIIRDYIIKLGHYNDIMNIENEMKKAGWDCDFVLHMAKEWSAKDEVRTEIATLFTKKDLEAWVEPSSSAKKGDYVESLTAVHIFPMTSLMKDDHDWQSHYSQEKNDFLSEWYDRNTILDHGFELVTESLLVHHALNEDEYDDSEIEEPVMEETVDA